MFQLLLAALLVAGPAPVDGPSRPRFENDPAAPGARRPDPFPEHLTLPEDGLPGPWPRLLGYNKVKPEGEVLIRTDRDDPLLVVGEYGKGRTAAFTSDCSPHWGSPEFVAWQGYGELWSRLISWLAGKL